MYLSRKLPNIDIEKRELEKQKDSSSLSKQILSVFPVLLFSTEPIKTIDNVSAKQDFQTGIQNLEKRHPKCPLHLRRFHRWRILYGIIGFLFSVVKWIIDLITSSQN